MKFYKILSFIDKNTPTRNRDFKIYYYFLIIYFLYTPVYVGIPEDGLKT